MAPTWAWNLGDPAAPEGWESSRVTMVKRLVPHVQQFVRVRQALVRAGAGDTTVTALLDNSRVGVVHLDQRGRILAANDRARGILQAGDGLVEKDGALGASAPEDQLRLDRLLASALRPGETPPSVGRCRSVASTRCCRSSSTSNPCRSRNQATELGTLRPWR